jgi:hypothetical protein
MELRALENHTSEKHTLENHTLEKHTLMYVDSLPGFLERRRPEFPLFAARIGSVEGVSALCLLYTVE